VASGSRMASSLFSSMGHTAPDSTSRF
jgi:hypothetical protein